MEQLDQAAAEMEQLDQAAAELEQLDQAAAELEQLDQAAAEVLSRPRMNTVCWPAPRAAADRGRFGGVF